MKVLLIQPPFTIFRTEPKKCHPPLGLAYLAAVLKESHEVMVLDALAEGYENEKIIDKEFMRYGLSFEDIKKRIATYAPDAVCISCLFSSQSINVYKICEAAKEVNNEIITILGGAHPSAVPDETLSDKNVDFVVIGEGEFILKKLLGHMEAKENVQEIGGIGFKRDGSIWINRRKEYGANLDELPFPYWDIFPLKKYYEINNPHGNPAKRVPFLPVITSRGCPFECIFCSVHNVWGRIYRVRSAVNVLSELSYLTDRFGIREILFEDDNLTLDKGRAIGIFKGIIDKGFGIVWNAPNGVAVQTLDGEMLELMKRSGCYSISIGVESGDEYVLKNIIRKPIVLSNIKPIVMQAKKLGLETTAFFVVGFPGETIKNIRNTFRFARSLNVDTANFFFASPLPGTRLLELFKEKRLVDKNLDYLKLKSDQPYSKTEHLSVERLTALVYREKLKLHILSLLTNPGKFLHKIWRKVKTNPTYFIDFGNTFLKKAG